MNIDKTKLKIVSDGDRFNTHVYIEDEWGVIAEVPHVEAVSWKMDCAETGMGTATLRCCLIGVEVDGIPEEVTERIYHQKVERSRKERGIRTHPVP